MKKKLILALSAITMGVFANCNQHQTTGENRPISIYYENPFYWEYNGKPVLLIGGSREDNLFNHPEGLEEHLDVLKAAGGNYIRNTMSSRNPGNPWAFKKLENGLYDLDQWDDDYWQRFENLLKLTSERDIIVQVEIWDPWDYFMTEAPIGFGPDNVGWESNPFNPMLNINYTAEESGLATEIDYYSGARPSGHIFFHTAPALKDVPVVRNYQERFLEKLLSISLNYPNVLYCMNNEIGEPAEWGEYWASFIRNIANEKGETVFLTDMRRNHDFRSDEQVRLLKDFEHYDFFEISQNNGINPDQAHWDMIMYMREQTKDRPKPLNNVKIYGGTIGQWTISVEEGTRRFWRNIFGGCATSRFHRPGPSEHFFGIGLSELAQSHIKSMRMFTDSFHIFTCQPSNHLLSNRLDNEAYCTAEEGKQYAVYFPDGGEVDIDLGIATGEWNIRWLYILESEWQAATTVLGGSNITLTAPGGGQWAALLVPASR